MLEHVHCFLQQLESERGFSANTISAYRNDLNQFVEFVTTSRELQTWRQLGDEDLRAYMLFLRERGYASSTVARKTAAIRSFCGYLVDSEILRSDPAQEISAPKVARSVPRAMTQRELDTLFAQPLIANSSDGFRDLTMFKVLYGTGMRVSELVGIDMAHVDLENRIIVCSGKQGRERRLSISSDVSDTLEEYLHRHRSSGVGSDSEQTESEEAEPESALFLNHRGHRLTRQGFWLILKNHAESAGISGITPHTLRHSFATHQLLDGRELEDVREMLGHVSISTTQVYEQLADEMRRSGPANSEAPAG